MMVSSGSTTTTQLGLLRGPAVPALMIRTESGASRTTAALFFVPTTMPKRRKLRRKNSQHMGERDRIVKDVDEDEG